MKITNRSGETITYRTFIPEDLLHQNSRDTYTLYEGSARDYGMGVDSVVIWVYQGSWTSGAFFMEAAFGPRLPTCLKSDAYANTTHILIVTAGNEWSAVNWGSLKSEWSGNAAHDRIVADASKGLEVAQILINSLATGVAALGPVGALPAGAILGVGSLIIMALGAEQPEPPAPPSVDEITNAIGKLLDEKSIKNDADKYARVFLTAGSWCIKELKVAHSELNGSGAEETTGDLTDHDREDFLRELENYLSDQSPFQIQLTHARHTPDLAKFILTPFLTGLVADLQMKRLHLLVRHLNGTRLTNENVSEFLGIVTQYKSDIAAARVALEAHTAGIVAEKKLTGTPEGTELTKLIYRTYTDHDDLTFLQPYVSALTDVATKVAEDVARLKQHQPPIALWKSEWDEHPRRKSKNPETK